MRLLNDLTWPNQTTHVAIAMIEPISGAIPPANVDQPPRARHAVVSLAAVVPPGYAADWYGGPQQ
jgi:hypothetical protein